MDKYDVTEPERRRLVEDLSEAAKELGGRIVGRAEGGEGAPGPEPAAAAAQGPAEQAAGTPGAARRRRRIFERYKRPRYSLRLKIENYAYTGGFLLSGLRPFLDSLFSFLWPRRDLISERFVRVLLADNPHAGDPSGYSLEHALRELARSAEALLKGGPYLRRESDRRIGLGAELTRDLCAWEPQGHRILTVYRSAVADRRLLESLDYLQRRHDAQAGIDVFELVQVIKGVYSLSLAVQGPLSAVERHLRGAAQLAKALYRRIYASEERLQQVGVRIDQETDQFLAALARLRWFARELYPAALKVIGRFRPLEQAEALLPQLYALAGLSGKEALVLPELDVLLPPGAAAGAAAAPAGQGTEGAAAQGAGQQLGAPPADGLPEEGEGGLNEEFRGILTLLEYAFPGSRLERIAQGDYSSLFWFHQRIFSDGEPRGPLVSRRPDFGELLWKVCRDDPVAPVILLHEVAGRMLGCLSAGALVGLADPLSGGAARLEQDLERLRREWASAREELLLRYLKEIDFLEKEVSLRTGEVRGRFLDSPAGRKTVETVNQIRNHLIKGYGQVALSLDRTELFRSRPLYAICKELLALLARGTVDRKQLQAGNPLAIQRLERAGIVRLPEQEGGAKAAGEPARGTAAGSDRLIRQILALIQALPPEKRLLASPRAEANRVFLELLSGVLELLHFLTADPRSPLRNHGNEVRFAGSVEKAVRAEISRDKTPLRVDLRRDLDLTDRLTGLATKNEYLALMPSLFRKAAESGEALSLLVLDLDRFKTINDTLGHDFGDEILKLAAEVLLACRREEDLAVRFGGDEMLVVLRGDWIAGMRQAERIRALHARLLQERHAEALAEIPRLAAQKELAARRQGDPHPAGSLALEELAARWKGLSLATLSIGVAQGLGRLERPCGDEKQLFRRADRMQYLAKDAGGNRAVVMAEEPQVPLTYAEFREYLEFRAGAARPGPAGAAPAEEGERDPRSFPDLLLASGRPLTHGTYSLEQYLSDSGGG